MGGGYGMGAGYGMGGGYGMMGPTGMMGPGGMPGAVDPNHAPAPPPSAWQALLAGVNGIMHFFGRLSFLVRARESTARPSTDAFPLRRSVRRCRHPACVAPLPLPTLPQVDENAHAVHFFIGALLQLLDRAGYLYAELARFILRILFRRRFAAKDKAMRQQQEQQQQQQQQGFGGPGAQQGRLALPAPPSAAGAPALDAGSSSLEVAAASAVPAWARAGGSAGGVAAPSGQAAAGGVLGAGRSGVLGGAAPGVGGAAPWGPGARRGPAPVAAAAGGGGAAGWDKLWG